MFEKIHRQIFLFVDERLFLWDPVRALTVMLTGKNDFGYYRITFKCSDGKSPQELLKNRMPMFRASRGLFCPPNDVIIHRYDIAKPNMSYVDEICTVLHEYGHYISYTKEKDPNKSEVGYVYEKVYDVKLRFKEEANAWRYGFITLWKFSLPFLTKVLLTWFCFWSAIEALSSYAPGSEKKRTDEVNGNV